MRLTQCCVMWMVYSLWKTPGLFYHIQYQWRQAASTWFPSMTPLSKADWWSLATLLSQLQRDLSPNLGNWIIFLSEVLATIITIPGNCSFLEITCHRKLCFSFQHIFPNFISLHGGEEAYVASQQHSLQTTENCRVIEATGAMDTHHPEISFCVTGSAKNATNLHYNMLFLSIINPLPLPSTLQNNIRTLKYPHQSPTLLLYLFFCLPKNKETGLRFYQV